MKASRLEKCRRMKQLNCDEALNWILFTDKKIFTVILTWNSQNYRKLLPKGSSWTVRVGKKLFSHEHHGLGWNFRPCEDQARYCAERGQTQCQHLPWADPSGRRHFLGSRDVENADWWLQQDWAPAHGAKKAIKWCEANIRGFQGKDIWPSNSPDVNPMYFTVWGIWEQKACSFKHKSVESLKYALENAWEEITPEDIMAILKNFQKRLQACIKTQGGHSETEIQVLLQNWMAVRIKQSAPHFVRSLKSYGCFFALQYLAVTLCVSWHILVVSTIHLFCNTCEWVSGTHCKWLQAVATVTFMYWQ